MSDNLTIRRVRRLPQLISVTLAAAGEPVDKERATLEGVVEVESIHESSTDSENVDFDLVSLRSESDDDECAPLLCFSIFGLTLEAGRVPHNTPTAKGMRPCPPPPPPLTLPKSVMWEDGAEDCREDIRRPTEQFNPAYRWKTQRP